MKKKSFMENAKSFLSSWKDDFGKKNKDILDSKKKRDEELEAMKQEMLKTFEEIKTDLEGKSKDVAETLTSEFAGFSDALKKGTAGVTEKIEIEKRFDQLKFFLKDAENTGAQKVDKLAGLIKEKLSDFDSELVSEKDTTKKTDLNEEMKNETETEINKNENIDDLQNDVNKLSDDIDNKIKD
ncbi:MAG: hypothetical protein ABFS35_02225 [Bacteroidota bacterium]